MKILNVTILTALLALPIFAQTPAPTATPSAAEIIEEDTEVLKIESDEVGLNVRVVDASNRAVANLAQAQFRVYEDEVLQPITSLTTAEVPTVSALVIDVSRSLRGQLGKIIEAGKIIVSANRPKDESAIVRFTSADKIEIVQDFTPNKSALAGALENLFVEGGKTAIIDAVYQTALKVEAYQNSPKKDDAKLRALVLVSDGDDRGSERDARQLLELLRKSQVQIYAIGFTDDLSREEDADGTSRRTRAAGFLSRLAQETGGKVYFPRALDELPQIAEEISGELRTQYLLSYAPTNDARDGSFRKIRVVVEEANASKSKLTAITRTGRTAAPK